MGEPNDQQNIPLNLIREIAERIDSGHKLSNRDLLSMCGEAGIDALPIEPHLCHETAETALNFLVATKYGEPLLSSDKPSAECREVLRPLQERLPTQSWRSSTQIAYQQFSTPARIAYLAAYLLELGDNDMVLEPSCGTGSLAVWAKAAGASAITNEIDARRRELCNLLGFNPTGFDAEFIDDLLPATLTPNVLLANPPFSSSGGRVERIQNKFGFRHVESALRRLEPGGRFAVVLGEGGSPGNASGRRFWDSVMPGIRVTRSIGLPGREYYRNGTTVGITLILGRKSKVDEPHGDVQRYFHQSFDNIEDAFNTLESR